MLSSILRKSFPVKANLDNQVPYASYPSANNTNLTDAQYANRIALANTVNKGMVQEKKSTTNTLLLGFGSFVLIGSFIAMGCIHLKGREKRKVEAEKGKQQRETNAEKAQNQIEVNKEREEEKRETLKLRAELEKEKKRPKGMYLPMLDDEGNEVEPDPIAKYIEALEKKENQLCGTKYSNSSPLPKQWLLGDLIRVGSFVGIGCDSGVGGSNFLMDIALAAAEGKASDIIPKLEGQEQIKPMKVLYLSAEEMLSTFNERNPQNWLSLIDYNDNVHFNNPYDCAREIYKKLCDCEENSLIVFDSVSLLFPQQMIGNDVQILLDLLKLMMKDAAEKGKYWTCLYRVHSTKSGTDRKTQKRDKLSGSIRWDQMGNTTMILSYGQKPNERCLHPMKCRNVSNKRDLTYIIRLTEAPYLHYEYVRTEGLPQRKSWKKLCRRDKEKIIITVR